MAVVYGCPGHTSYGRGLTETFVHDDGCCAQFALMSPQRRAETGMAWVAPQHRPASEKYEVDTIGVPELVELVNVLQRQAAEQPDAPVPGVIRYVLLPHDYPFEQFAALLELGQPYGLVVGWSRLPQPVT